jgi:hypothetical protein
MAAARQLIPDQSADGIVALAMMHNLAVHGGHDLASTAKAREFLALTDGVLLGLNRAYRDAVGPGQ